MLIDIITPIMLSLSPSLKEVPLISYDWKTQKSIIQLADGTVRPNDTGTTRGTSSYLNGTLIIDDANSD